MQKLLQVPSCDSRYRKEATEGASKASGCCFQQLLLLKIITEVWTLNLCQHFGFSQVHWKSKAVAPIAADAEEEVFREIF